MSSLETWFWSLLLVVVFPAVAVGGALLVRRVVGSEVLARHNDVAGFIYAVIGVLYAVLLGFTAIIVWEQFRRAQEGAELEANALADLYRDAQVFPAAVRGQIETRLRDYVRLVVEQEWPAMAAGERSAESWDAYNLLWRTYHEFMPQDDHQRIWYAQSVERMNLLGDQRRNRLLSVRAGRTRRHVGGPARGRRGDDRLQLLLRHPEPTSPGIDDRRPGAHHRDRAALDPRARASVRGHHPRRSRGA